MLPSLYQYLKAPDMPRAIQIALSFYGLQEVPGSRHNPTILAWADTIGIGDKVNDDEQAWCGLFMAYVMHQAGKNLPMQGWDLLRALKWLQFGQKVTTPGIGDVLVISREGGGHVCLYVGEDATHYHVLGGNQSNGVNITRIAKNRCVGIRRPLYNNQPTSVRQVHLSATGPVSTNEA